MKKLMMTVAATALITTSGFAYADGHSEGKMVEMPDGTVMTHEEAHKAKMINGDDMVDDESMMGKTEMTDEELLEDSAAPVGDQDLMMKEGTLEGNLEVMKEQELNNGVNTPTGAEPNAANETESMLDEDLRRKEGLSEAGDVLETEPSMNSEMLDNDLRVKEGLTQDEPGVQD